MLVKTGADVRTTHPKRARTSNAMVKRKAQGGEAPATKKQRTARGSVALTPAFPIEMPTAGPDWVFNALGSLSREDLGPQWQLLVVTWLAREERAEFVEQSKLPAKGRPPLIGEWIKNARKPTHTLTVSNAADFEKMFLSWWNSLQPEWRIANETNRLERGDDNWDCLRECSTGANGILSVMAGLCFWGSATLTDSQRNAWDTAVDDVLYVLQQLA